MKSMSKTIQKQEEEIREEKRKYTVLSPKNLSCESPLIWNILKHVLTSFVLFWRCGGKGGTNGDWVGEAGRRGGGMQRLPKSTKTRYILMHIHKSIHQRILHGQNVCMIKS